MEKAEILEKAKTKHPVGEMEKQNISKCAWIGFIVAGVVAVALMIAEGAQGHYTSIFALAMVLYLWASVFYFCQFLIAKRRFVGIMIGAVLEAVAAVIMLVLYILFSIGMI